MRDVWSFNTNQTVAEVLKLLASFFNNCVCGKIGNEILGDVLPKGGRLHLDCDIHHKISLLPFLI